MKKEFDSSIVAYCQHPSNKINMAQSADPSAPRPTNRGHRHQNENIESHDNDGELTRYINIYNACSYLYVC